MERFRNPVGVLVGAERAIFAFVGALFFVAAFALAIRSTVDLWALISGPSDEIIESGTAFLDLMLLVLMMVELAYTVIVSMRGKVLSAEPFLIVGLIAVIRRILVITIGDVNKNAPVPGAQAVGGMDSQPYTLIILTAVVLVLVGSIVLLRSKATMDERLDGEMPEPRP
jgi:uncharacterized membrane protein (DUF373 family)